MGKKLAKTKARLDRFFFVYWLVGLKIYEKTFMAY